MAYRRSLATLSGAFPGDAAGTALCNIFIYIYKTSRHVDRN